MLSKKQLKFIAAFVAGRVAAKEVELGDESFLNETDEQKFARIDQALVEFVGHTEKLMPELLPPELLAIDDEYLN